MSRLLGMSDCSPEDPATGAVAVITGATGGLGRATADRFAKAGWRVAGIARSGIALEEWAQDVKARWTASPLPISADVRSLSELTDAARQVRMTFGAPAAAVVACAGTNIRRTLMESTEDDWREVLDTNALGSFLTIKAFAPGMIERGAGAFVLTSSVQARSGGTSPQYAASKSAIHGLAFVAARELAPSGIRVNVVAPGSIDAGMASMWSEDTRARLMASTLLGRLATPDEIANCILFLATTESSYLTGSVMDVNGGAWVG